MGYLKNFSLKEKFIRKASLESTPEWKVPIASKKKKREERENNDIIFLIITIKNEKGLKN